MTIWIFIFILLGTHRAIRRCMCGKLKNHAGLYKRNGINVCIYNAKCFVNKVKDLMKASPFKNWVIAPSFEQFLGPNSCQPSVTIFLLPTSYCFSKSDFELIVDGLFTGFHFSTTTWPVFSLSERLTDPCVLVEHSC